MESGDTSNLKAFIQQHRFDFIIDNQVFVCLKLTEGIESIY